MTLRCKFNKCKQEPDRKEKTLEKTEWAIFMDSPEIQAILGPRHKTKTREIKYIILFNSTKCNAEKMQCTKDIIMFFIQYINLVLCDVICQVKSTRYTRDLVIIDYYVIPPTNGKFWVLAERNTLV